MGFLKAVQIVSVQVEKGAQEGSYGICANLDAVTSDGVGYYGPFQVTMYTDGKTPMVEISETAGYLATVTDWDPGKRYYVKAYVESGSAKVESKEVELLLEGIEGLKASLEDGYISICWDKPAAAVKQGILMVDAERGSVFDVKPGLKQFRLSLSEISYTDLQPVMLSVAALGKDGICTGPSSCKVQVMLKNPVLTAINWIEEKQDGLHIAVSYQNPYEASRGVGAKIVLLLKDRYGNVLRSNPQEFGAEKKNGEFAVVHAGQTGAEIQESCTALCMLETEGFINEDYEGQMGIPLGYICRFKKERRHNVLRVCWEFAGIAAPTACEISYNGDSLRVMECEWRNESYSLSDTAQSITVTPCFGTARGAVSQALDLFQPCYAVENNRCLLYGEAGQADIFQVNYDTELCKDADRCTEPVEEGPYKLEKQEKGYRFTVNPASKATAAKTESFLRRLEKAGVKKEYLLLIQRQAGYGLPHYLGETLAFAYGLTPSARCMDIRAGMVLCLEPEGYKYKETEEDQASGFYPVGSLEYPVGVSQNTQGEIGLQVSSFIRQFSDWFEVKNQDAVENEDKGPRYCVGGVIDFFQQGMSGPFWRLVYPSVIPGSGLNTSSFPGEHMMLLSAPTLDIMKQSMDILSQPLIILSELPAAVCYIRGRNTIKVKIPVWWENKKKLVEIGTTLGQMLSMEGMADADMERLVWERSTVGIISDGAYRYVRVQTQYKADQQLNSMALLQEDRIHFE